MYIYVKAEDVVNELLKSLDLPLQENSSFGSMQIPDRALKATYGQVVRIVTPQRTTVVAKLVKKIDGEYKSIGRPLHININLLDTQREV